MFSDQKGFSIKAILQFCLNQFIVAHAICLSSLFLANLSAIDQSRERQLSVRMERSNAEHNPLHWASNNHAMDNFNLVVVVAVIFFAFIAVIFASQNTHSFQSL